MNFALPSRVRRRGFESPRQGPEVHERSHQEYDRQNSRVERRFVVMALVLIALLIWRDAIAAGSENQASDLGRSVTLAVVHEDVRVREFARSVDDLPAGLLIPRCSAPPRRSKNSIGPNLAGLIQSRTRPDDYGFPPKWVTSIGYRRIEAKAASAFNPPSLSQDCSAHPCDAFACAGL